MGRTHGALVRRGQRRGSDLGRAGRQGALRRHPRRTRSRRRLGAPEGSQGALRRLVRGPLLRRLHHVRAGHVREHAEAGAPGGAARVVRGPDVMAETETHWSYDTVARLLAEARAIHPKVHTSTRIANYLEQHGWQRVESPQPQPGRRAHWPWWSPPDPDHIRWIHPSGIEVDAPLSDDAPGYAESVRVVVNRIVWAATGTISAAASAVSEVLLEIAQQPDEVAW